MPDGFHAELDEYMDVLLHLWSLRQLSTGRSSVISFSVILFPGTVIFLLEDLVEGMSFSSSGQHEAVQGNPCSGWMKAAVKGFVS